MNQDTTATPNKLKTTKETQPQKDKNEIGICIISYRSLKRKSFTRNRIEHNLLSYIDSPSSPETQIFISLPISSIIVVCERSRPLILGYLTGNAVHSSKVSDEITRPFRKLQEVATPDSTHHKKSLLLPQQTRLKKISPDQLNQFTDEILIPHFNHNWTDLVNFIIQDFRDRTLKRREQISKRKIAINWTTDIDRDKKFEPSWREAKQRDDAITPWRRASGSGFSKK